MQATPHHIGCAVKVLDGCQRIYASAFGLNRRTRSFDVRSQGVRVCFVELVNGFYLELVQPSANAAALDSYLRVGFYHLCFLVDQLELARQQLKFLQFSPLPAFESEAFDRALCQFYVSPQLHLIELVQMSPADFDRFFSSNLSPQGYAAG